MTRANDAHATPRVSVPRLARTHVSRDRLLTRLDEAETAGATVLHAAAGTGKTSLLAEWATRPERRDDLVWVTLHPGIRSAPDLWNSLLHALHRHLGAPSLPAHVRPLDALSGLLSEISRDLRLVLDDLHHASDASIATLASLLERSPHVRLTAATRRLTGLEIAPTSARLDTVLLGTAELAFTVDETATLLDAVDPALHASALHHQAQTGGHALATRVLADAGPLDEQGTRALLLTTARPLLETLDAPTRRAATLLAYAPTADTNLARHLTEHPDPTELFTTLERSGAGHASAAGARHRFSFHPLALLALTAARAELSPGERARASHTAARHFAAGGDPLTAFRVCLDDGNLEELWPLYLSFRDRLGEADADGVEHAVRRLSPTQLDAHPELAILVAMLRARREIAPTAQTAVLVAHATRALAHDLDSHTGRERVLRELALLGGQTVINDFATATATADRLLAQLSSAADTGLSSDLDLVEAAVPDVVETFVIAGRIPDAIVAARLGSVDERPHRVGSVLGNAALAYAAAGEIDAARAVLVRLPEAPLDGRPAIPATFARHVASAIIAMESGDAAGAMARLNIVHEDMPRTALWPYAVWTHAHVLLATGNAAVGADEILSRIRSLRRHPVSATVHSMLGATASDLLLAAGQRDRAEQLLADLDPDSPEVRLATARLALADDRLDVARDSVAPILWDDASSARDRQHAHLLRAVVAARLTRAEDAATEARRALALSTTYGVRSAFMFAPHEELRSLTPALGEAWIPLLDAVPDAFADALRSPSLTRREAEVLAALTESSRNEEIAARLFVSTNTIKTQRRSVYRKLGVSTRADAIRVGRSRGLLPD